LFELLNKWLIFVWHNLMYVSIVI